MTNAAQNHYDVLGLDRTASTDDVRSAYRLRSHMFHPDKYETYPEPLRGQLKAEAAKEFKKLTAAYEVLRDPEKRAAHDRQLNTVYGYPTRPTPARTVRPARAKRAPSKATVREVNPGAGGEEEEAQAERPKRAPRRPAEPPQPRERDPLLVVRPDRLDFGTLAINSSKQMPIKIANAGGRTLFGEISSNRAWLSVNRRSFISSSTLLFVSVDTAGLQPGEEYSGTLVVTTLNGGDQAVPVVMRVSGRPEPILAGAPSLLDFGVTQPGGTKARTIKLSNAGTGTLIGSVAVRGEWLAVTETRFRGNAVSFEVIANPGGLPPGEHQGELLLFSNGGQATIQVLVEIPKRAPGSTIVAEPPREEREDQGEEARSGEGTAPEVDEGGEEERREGTLSKAQQRALLERVMKIEPGTVWERDFLRRIVQLVRGGDALAPGELAKIYELEAQHTPERPE
jgi:hypothetical protein